MRSTTPCAAIDAAGTCVSGASQVIIVPASISAAMSRNPLCQPIMVER